MSPKRSIVIIDNDEEFVAQFQEMLSLNGYKARAFTDGKSGINSVTELIPDLIFLDMKLNGVSGLDVVTELKKDSKTIEIPIIILSSQSDSEKAQNLLEKGEVKKCIKKPFHPDEIFCEIKKYSVSLS